MSVVFEFLSIEPIENLITPMHYKIDTVVYFTYKALKKDRAVITQSFLEKYCNVKNVEFVEIPDDNMEKCFNVMYKKIKAYSKEKCYFDITGAESVSPVVFGMISREFNTPIHMFNIEKNEIIEFEEGAIGSIDRDEKHQDIKLDLKKYIEMKGGVISGAERCDEKYRDDVYRVIEIEKKYEKNWNKLTHLTHGLLREVEGKRTLTVDKSYGEVLGELEKIAIKPKELNAFLDDMEAAGLVTGLIHENGKCKFKLKNDFMRKLLEKGGNCLEYYTYYEQVEGSEDCLQSVRLDWDGALKSKRPIKNIKSEDINILPDVFNEVDVMSIDGVIPTFISCKSGNMDDAAKRNALYELDSVARRFGGKYAKKRLMTTVPFTGVFAERANEMWIQVLKVGKKK